MKLSYHYAARHALGQGRSKDQPVRRADIVVLTRLREQVLRRVAESDSHNSGTYEPWNHNHHYHGVITGVIGPDCQHAHDVGCGQGTLTRRLRALVPEVTGIDRDERSIALARARARAQFPDVRYIQGDFLTAPIAPESADLVTAVASLHHMDAEAALRKMADVLRPGGVLVVVGLARDASAADILLAVPAAIGNLVHRGAQAWRRRGAGRPPEPGYQSPVIWPPALSYRQARRLAERVLPGVRYRRRLYWRYSLMWLKPGP